METREKQKRRKGKRGRRKSKELMDAALDAYIRHLALEKWRQVTDLQETLGVDVGQAVRDVGCFPERGAYGNIWERWWQTHVVGIHNAETSPLIEHIEAAVQGALEEEIVTRQKQEDVTVEDTLGYKAFLDSAMDHLFEEEEGSIEEM
ncbi:MAG: hypothetical protein ACE5HC_02555 [Candidatus Binatia bacterium]